MLRHELEGAAPSIADEAADVPQAPAQEYQIRRFVPEDGPGIARCFSTSRGGYNYVTKSMYSPDRIAALNANGGLFSFVAIGADGDVAGHYGLRPHPHGPVAEGCTAAIMPAHRGRALMERLRAFAESQAPRLGFAGLYFEPVTDHVFTQRANERDGAHVCQG